MPVRVYKEEDLPRIYEIEKSAHKDDAAPDFVIKNAIDKGHCIVFDSTMFGIVGFIIIWDDLQITDKDDEYHDDEPYPYVWDIAIDSQYQSMGFGAILMETFINTYLSYDGDCEKVWLLVNSNNTAYGFYYRLGFRADGFVRHYYRTDEHAIVMVKRKVVE